MSGKIIWTVGHSNLALSSFLDIVRDVDVLADIRRFPYSPRYPHFNGDSLKRVKGYRWFEALGGRRREPGARHTAWRVAAFRSYAGYMETEPFRRALSELQTEAVERPTAVLCAEALWWRCHRRLVSDALLVLGWRVIHLPSGRSHELSASARVAAGGTLIYDQPPSPPKSKGSSEGH